MYCSKCGNNNNQDNKYCVNCGNKLHVNTNNQSDGNKETSLVLGIICLVSSFFINILCFIPGIISIGYAKKYKKDSGKLGVGFGLSLAGMIFSFLMFLITILLFVSIVNWIGIVGSEIDNNINAEYTYNIPSV